jgi:hypothetical protein
MQRFHMNIVYINEGGDDWMFEKEIQNKNIVELYDNRLDLLASGIITGYKAKSGYIVIDYCVFYPINHIAKITVHSKDKVHQGKTANM